MHDIDVRVALHAELLDVHSSDLAATRFVDELDLCGEVRVDVAVLNGSFSGFELKSARDNLRRLPKQVDFYSKTLDFASLVVANNHYRSALSLIPDWWGVISASESETEGRVFLEHCRPARPNPGIEVQYLARLLWRDELLGELVRLGHDRGVRSKPRRVLLERLCEVSTQEDIRFLVRETLKSRSRWRVE